MPSSWIFMMPVMDGMMATRHIREILEIVVLPIIAITGQSLHKIEKEAFQAGFTHVLEKPVECQEVLKGTSKNPTFHPNHKPKALIYNASISQF